MIDGQKKSTRASALQLVLALILICISVVLVIAATQKPSSAGNSAGARPPASPALLAVAASNTPLTKTLTSAEHGLSIRYPENWSVGAKRFTNMEELVNIPAAKQGDVALTARIKIRHQTRLDHGDALNELVEISKEMKATVTFLTLGGWPALQRTTLEERQQPDEARRFEDPQMIRVTTAIAAGSSLIRIDAILPSSSDAKLIGDTKAIEQSISLKAQGDAGQSGRDLDVLRTKVSTAAESLPIQPAGRRVEQPRGPQIQQVPLPNNDSPDPGPGASRVFNGGNGELEIVASKDAKTVIIGRQNNWITSKDGGQTFPFSGTLNFGDGDPSLGLGVSGNYYIAGIRTSGGGCTFPGVDPNPTHIYGYTCTGFRRSTDGGQTFPILGNALVCPNDNPATAGTVADQCFPDQEHIAVDRINPAPGGDQVYSTWRNFDSTDQDPGIVCSQDSGVTWTAPADVDSGFIPRIGVGQDGFVYVVYRSGSNIRVNKYSSCSSGLAAQPGFPKTISTVNDITCPVPGLDRCNDGNNLSSIMVAVDDTNPNHVYVAYANETAAGNQDVLVRDSIDGGANWPAGRVVTLNTAVPGVRFMPWISTTTGNAVVSWYDRRSATPCPVPPCAANNDLTDYYAGGASLDSGGNLVAGPEIKLTNAADPQCAAGKAPGSAASWPCSTRSNGDAETCSAQPQLAGVCCDNSMPGCPGSQTPCDFSSGPACGGAETCNGGGGCPKYGDYNGNAAAAGRLFFAWASAVPPTGIPASGNVDVFFAAKVAGGVPVVSVPGGAALGDACLGSTVTGTLNVCNTGKADLEVTSITSSNPKFAVTTPSSGYPVEISPDFCFPFQVTFTPTTTGPQSATLTISTNDPANPTVTVQATGNGSSRTIKVTGSATFGTECAGAGAEKTLSVCNVGKCDLQVTNAAFAAACPDFTLVNNPFPATLSQGSCLDLTVKYTPTSAGPKSCTLVISSNDPVNPTVNVPVTASTSGADIDVPLDQTFPPTVNKNIGPCNSSQLFPISNKGACNLTITDIAISGTNAGDYSIAGLPSFPITVQPGHVAGDGSLSLVFAPTAVARSRSATVSVTYVSDPATSATVTISRALCGEGVSTGARVLVTHGGVPLATVDKIYLKRVKKKQTKGTPVTVQETIQNVALQSVAAPCQAFQFHREWGGATNPVQLLTGDYQLQITTKIAGHKVVKVASFSVDTCNFNQTIVIDL